jgi:DNA-binding response OmpR family regulator
LRAIFAKQSRFTCLQCALSFWRCPIAPSLVLVIEDDEIVARTIERSLRGDEFRPVLVSSGIEGLHLARRRRPDLVILDVIMPGMDGYAVCREMRADPNLSAIPVLFLTARLRDEDKIAGFLAGGDDYLTKPFNIDELILRLRALLRRSRPVGRVVSPPTADAASQPSASVGRAVSPSTTVSPSDPVASPTTSPPPVLQVGPYILDLRSYELITPTRGKVRLTPIQFELLQHLMRHPGEIFSPGRLLDEVWDYPSNTGSADLVRVHIKNLRERIEVNPHKPTFILTVPGYGYTVSSPPKY